MLAEHAARRSQPQSMIAEAAIASFLSPDAAERQEAVLVKRLDQIDRRMTRLERDVGIAVESLAGDVRTLLRDKDIRHSGIRRDGTTLTVRFRDDATRKAARPVLQDNLVDLIWTDATDPSGDLALVGSLNPKSERAIQEQALKQNITTLHNRINELGVSEPVIQQQGLDRVVVQLPGVQDTAKAKDIIGRTATLEVRMADDSTEAQAALGGGMVPFGSERYLERGGVPIIVKRQVVLTGDNLTDAQPGFDENHEAAVHLTLDARGVYDIRLASRPSVAGRRWAATISASESDLGGYKDVQLAIKSNATDPSEGVWAHLKYEGGVHRVQRVPETEAAGRIHTSTVTVAVLPEAEDVEVELHEKDLRIDVYRSSGPGGQSVNTTDSAVRITHLPTGVVVSCQNEKSQLQNKESAMRILRARLIAFEEEKRAAEASANRKSQVRTVDRSERIRTYNFPENRIADHRVGFKANNLDAVLNGELEPVIEACIEADTQAKLKDLGK